MNKNTVKKFFSMIFVIVVSLNQMTFGVSLSKNNYLEIEDYIGDYRIYSRIGNEKYIYYEDRLQTNYEYYYLDKNGKEMPAYCLELGVDGAETVNEYYVNVSKKINDEKLNNIILNGYPYKSVKELGVENVTEAKYSTQFAVWSYLSNLDTNKITPALPKYNRVVEAIKQIYNVGINSNCDLDNLINMKTTKIDIDSINKNFFSTTVSLEYNKNVKDIKLNLKGIDEYIITDEFNNELSDLFGIYKFKILIPRSTIFEDTKVEFCVEYNTLQTAIMFGKAKVSNMQNLSLISEPITFKHISNSLNIEYIPEKFKLIKYDKDDNNIKLENVKFRIFDMENKVLGEFLTDKNGEINLDVLKQLRLIDGQKIKIEEVKTQPNYYFDKEQNSKIYEIKYGEENIVNFENEKIKGKIKIIKTSNDYNKFNEYELGTFLSDAFFEIYDENYNLVQEVVTNENGEAISKDLLKGKYYIKEKKAPKYYRLDKKIYEVEVTNHNEVITLYLKNSSEKLPELPKTGC